MVEHRDAGSWLGKPCFSLEVRWLFLEVHCPEAPSGAPPPPPSDHPIRGERGGVAPWTAEGDFRSLSLEQPMVTLPGARNAARGVPSLRSWGGRGRVLSDTAIWVPNGLSRVGLARVRSGSGSSGNPVASLGGMLVCLRWQPYLVGTVSFRPEPFPSRLFFKEPYGEIGPLPA